MWLKLPTIYRGAIIIAIPAISILPTLATWSWLNQSQTKAQQQIGQTEKVIHQTSLLMKYLVDAETGVRGYTITGETEFLEPYKSARSQIPNSLNTLEKSIANDPEQQVRLQQTERQIKTRLNLLSEVLEQQASSTASNSSELLRLLTEGKAEMDRIRQSIDAFQAEEWRSFKTQQQHLAWINRISDVAIGISIFSILLAYGLAIKLYLQSERELQHQAQKLADINQNLVTLNHLLENRNQELSQFAYIVSHDLKAPLRGISNLSQWIEEDLEDKLDLDSRQNMSLLRSRVRRMNDFIDGLLEYSRAGEEREQTEVDVRKLLDEIIDEIAPPPQFIIDIEAEIPTLYTEAVPLRQVFGNLINNSIKHHPRDNGRIAISATLKEKHYQFSIQDDGAGIPLEQQAKIFAIFQTLSSKDRKENTGIGLSIVKKILENRGDKIWLESEPGKGTTFYFTWTFA